MPLIILDFQDENGKKVNAITYKKAFISVTLSDQNVSVANENEGMAVKLVVTVSYGRDSLTLKEKVKIIIGWCASAIDPLIELQEIYCFS